MASLRVVEEKYKTNLHRTLIKIAMVQACQKALKSPGEQPNEINETIARHILNNPDYFFEKIYLLVLSDDRIDDNVSDNNITKVVEEVVSIYQPGF